MKIYTWQHQPFQMGGPLEGLIATVVEEYERIGIGQGYYGVIVRNPEKKLFHVALEACGAIVGTDRTRVAALARVMADVETGDPKLMEEQIEDGVRDCESATLLSNEQFFGNFKGDER